MSGYYLLLLIILVNAIKWIYIKHNININLQHLNSKYIDQ